MSLAWPQVSGFGAGGTHTLSHPPALAAARPFPVKVNRARLVIQQFHFWLQTAVLKVRSPDPSHQHCLGSCLTCTLSAPLLAFRPSELEAPGAGPPGDSAAGCSLETAVQTLACARGIAALFMTAKPGLVQVPVSGAVGSRLWCARAAEFYTVVQ